MKRNRYIIHIQFLGFRFHGWAKQTGLLTVHGMVDKTTRFVLGHEEFKTIGCSRTDAKVSALHYVFELIVDESLNTDKLLRDYNSNFPQDIRVIKVEIPHNGFNIINSPRLKEYAYLFSYGKKPHPFSASLITTFPDDLNIDLMKQGALLFEGRHNFRKYCTQPSANTITEREVLVSRIEENNILRADHIPDHSFAYHVHAKGFMRNQVRLMMAQLVLLGKQEIDLADISHSLSINVSGHFQSIAPASGLLLHKIHFDQA